MPERARINLLKCSLAPTLKNVKRTCAPIRPISAREPHHDAVGANFVGEESRLECLSHCVN